jgi:hypothetical protein
MGDGDGNGNSYGFGDSDSNGDSYGKGDSNGEHDGSGNGIIIINVSFMVRSIVVLTLVVSKTFLPWLPSEIRTPLRE